MAESHSSPSRKMLSHRWLQRVEQRLRLTLGTMAPIQIVLSPGMEAEGERGARRGE